LVHGNYADLPVILRAKKLGKADGLLLDLGFSSEQLENSGRGFSFSERALDEPLLMTYSDDCEPVRAILRRISEKELADIIYQLGGERRSRQIAKAIVERRRRKPIETAGDLADIVRGALPKSYERGRIDPATRTFQALRIYANGELENLEKMLGELPEILKPGGRVAIITFHSLEDKIVKENFKQLARVHFAEIINKKPIIASREEIEHNPRARSAKLRAIRLGIGNRT
jgi:16S rRNA (cytosine1402-N4)-methyltransferase